MFVILERHEVQCFLFSERHDVHFYFQKDMKYIVEHPDLFHHTIVNDDLEIANSELNTALKPFIESEQEQN